MITNVTSSKLAVETPRKLPTLSDILYMVVDLREDMEITNISTVSLTVLMYRMI